MPFARTLLRCLSVLAVLATSRAIAVQPASDPALADTSGCTALIDIAQESLRGEINVACTNEPKASCEVKNAEIRALLDIIDQRRKRNADECGTLAQINRLLRLLPPKS